jgi:hypothetical protein
MRLKLIAMANFQYSEADNFNAVMKKHPHITLGPDDVVVLFSQSKNQIVFMYRTTELDFSQRPSEDDTGFGRRKGKATVYNSKRLRLSRSTWDVMMLQNYANEVGIELDGLKRFEDIYEGSRREPKKARTKTTKPGKVIALRKAA